MASKSEKKTPTSAATNLIGRYPYTESNTFTIRLTKDPAGGGAGMMEALVCHPLGTVEQTARL